MRLEYLLLASSLFLLRSWALYGEGSPDEAAGEPQPAIATPADSDCPGPPPGSQPLEYRVLFMQTRQAPGEIGPETAATAEPEAFLPVRDQEEIRDETEYRRIFGRPSAGIDWTASRILVVQQITTWKLGALESTVMLSGIYQQGDAIHIGRTITHHGPCQGIAQLSEWFSSRYTDLFILLPAGPARIVNFYCVIGGCPPGIP